MKLNVKLMLWTVVLAAVLITASSYIAFIDGTRILYERVEAQLESVTVLKNDEFENVIAEEAQGLRIISKNTLLRDSVADMMKSQDHNGMNYSTDRKNARAMLEDNLRADIDFPKIFIMDMDGVIQLSTEESEEGKIRSLEPYFINGRNETFSQSFYYDISIHEPVITIATPLRDSEGRVVAVLAGNVNLQRITDLMWARSGLGETGETYIVNRFNYALTKLKNEEGAVLKKSLHTEGVKRCLKERRQLPTILHYTSYNNDPVIGVYYWNAKNEVCMIAEISEKEALAPLIELRNSIVYGGLILMAAAVLMSYFISQSISKPISILHEGVEKISGGDLDHKVKVSSSDEIEELATAFNRMTEDLSRSHLELKNVEKEKRKELEILVTERTKELAGKTMELERSRAATLNILEDVSEAKNRVEKNYTQLKNLDEMKDDFVGATSHALKTPLTSINSFINLLMTGKLGPISQDQRDGLEIIQSESQRLQVLINNILDASKLDSGRIILDKKKTNLKTLVEKAIKSASKTAESRGDKINFTSPPEVEAPIDVAWMEKTLDNLISNAIKYTDNGTIDIRLDNDENTVKLTITDTGRGIKPEYFPHLFKKFYQEEQQTTTGTGLGIYICKYVIEAHGGQIGASSPGPDKGATFWFTIPSE